MRHTITAGILLAAALALSLPTALAEAPDDECGPEQPCTLVCRPDEYGNMRCEYEPCTAWVLGVCFWSDLIPPSVLRT